jgi:hypothetical protein
MAEPTRIFVSHSSANNALTDEVCELLRAPPPAGGGYDVLVDIKSLETADPWPLQLHEMMADCHAAVILLTTDALQSAWVLKEATILTWRRSLEPGFKLFFVQFPDVTDEHLKQARYEPLQHRLIQGLPSTSPQAIAGRVHARLQQDAVQPAVTLYDRLVLSLSGHLGDLPTQVLQSIADRLDVPSPPWRPGHAAQHSLINGIACRILRGSLGTYASLKDLMNELKSGKLLGDSLKKILRFTAPHWVSAEAAGLLGALVEEDQGQLRCRAAAINGNFVKRYTGEMYVKRAYPLSFEYGVCGPNPPAAGDTIEHYTRKIVEFCVANFPACEAMESDEVIGWLQLVDPCLFVVVSPLDHKALTALQAAFPRVRFLISTGPGLAENALPRGVLPLRPLVDVAAEGTAYKDYGLCQNVVKD